MYWNLHEHFTTAKLLLFNTDNSLFKVLRESRLYLPYGHRRIRLLSLAPFKSNLGFQLVLTRFSTPIVKERCWSITKQFFFQLAVSRGTFLFQRWLFEDGGVLWSKAHRLHVVTEKRRPRLVVSKVDLLVKSFRWDLILLRRSVLCNFSTFYLLIPRNVFLFYDFAYWSELLVWRELYFRALDSIFLSTTYFGI